MVNTVNRSHLCWADIEKCEDSSSISTCVPVEMKQICPASQRPDAVFFLLRSFQRNTFLHFRRVLGWFKLFSYSYRNNTQGKLGGVAIRQKLNAWKIIQIHFVVQWWASWVEIAAKEKHIKSKCYHLIVRQRREACAFPLMLTNGHALLQQLHVDKQLPEVEDGLWDPQWWCKSVGLYV